jgi:DNA-binding GntR family transcriptional regulator
MTQDPGRALPKYRQLAGDLRARIEAGEYPADSLMPTKPELMRRYGASLGTVDHAIAELRALGLVETKQGVGMYARRPPPEDGSSEYKAVMSRIDAITEEVRQLREDVAALKRARGT